jgi:glycosyltransferase involved in cell wall biosynthesis
MGGPSVVAYNLVREFDKKDVEVDFAFGISRQQLNQNDSMSEILGFSENVNLIPIVKSERSPRSYKTSFDFRFLEDLYMLSRRVNDGFDLVHFNGTPNTRDVFVPFLSRLRAIPTIFREGGWINYETFSETKNESRFLTYYDYFTFMLLRHFFTRIVCNSSDLKQKLVQAGFFKREKVEEIPNGIDTGRFKNAEKMELEGDPNLLYVGRLELIKGIDILVGSMKRITKQLPRAVLHIVGDGSMMNQLKNFVGSNGLEKTVVFHGHVSEELPSFYKSADICIVPSRFETFGIVILEAMSAGKPVIASRRGGIPEIIENFENGILIEPNEDDLLKSIVSLWNDKNLLNKMCLKNSEKVKNYEWGKIADRYLKMYESVLASTQ